MIKPLITRNVRAFYNFIYMPHLGIFRIMEERGVCRLILNQVVVAREAQPMYLHDLPFLETLMLCASECGAPIYRKEDRIATFFRLRCRRYWIPVPVPTTSRDEGLLTEWAEYQTDDYEIDFGRYNEIVVRGHKQA